MSNPRNAAYTDRDGKLERIWANARTPSRHGRSLDGVRIACWSSSATQCAQSCRSSTVTSCSGSSWQYVTAHRTTPGIKSWAITSFSVTENLCISAVCRHCQQPRDGRQRHYPALQSGWILQACGQSSECDVRLVVNLNMLEALVINCSSRLHTFDLHCSPAKSSAHLGRHTA